MKLFLLRPLITFGVLFLIVTLAQAKALTNNEIKTLFSGKVVILKLPVLGEFPLRYDKNGIVKGDGTGTGLGRYLAPKDEGRWWISDNQLCQKWQEWYDGKTTCFAISNLDGKNFRWTRNDGRKGKGRVK